MTAREFLQGRGAGLRGVLLKDLRERWALENPSGFMRNATEAPQRCGGLQAVPEDPPPFLKGERCAICQGIVAIDRNVHWLEIVIDRVAVLREDEELVDTRDSGYRGAFPVGAACAAEFPEVTFKAAGRDGA